jgi:hypothetical protein
MGHVMNSSKENIDPQPIDKAMLESDAPALLPLSERCRNIHIYSRSHPQFQSFSRVLASHTDAVPLAIVRVASEQEVVATIQVCEAVGLPVAVRSGGNDFGDRNYVDGGVTIDVRLLDSIVVSPDHLSARIGGGVFLEKLLKALDHQDLDTPCGWGPRVGYVAWASGGGYGCEAGSRGLGVDQILAARIVTAQGQIIKASPTDDQDAYWALRGGGAGTLGVVSQLTIKVYPKPRLLAGSVTFPFSQIETVFTKFQRLFAESFPNKFGGEIIVLNPPGSGGIVNHFFWWQLEDDESDLVEAETYLHQIKQFGTVVADTVTHSTFSESKSPPGENANVRNSDAVQVPLYNSESDFK